MKRTIRQHTIPRVYLKYFSSNSFVHVFNSKDKYRKHVQKKGISDKIFCRKAYYDFPNKNNQQYIENGLSSFEGKYHDIISRLENRTILNYDTKQLIINWLHISKIRSTRFRDHMGDMIGWIEKTKYGLMHGADAMKEKEREFAERGKMAGKLFQIESFLDEKHFNDFKKQHSLDFLQKDWTVLISKDRRFLTSDNPGFSHSINHDWIRLNYSPLTEVYNLSGNGFVTHFFPLSSSLCLMAKPFLWDDQTSEEIIRTDVLRDISFAEATGEFVDMINLATIETSNELIIAQEVSDIQKYLKDHPSSSN
jgi:hypothetical protein